MTTITAYPSLSSDEIKPSPATTLPRPTKEPTLTESGTELTLGAQPTAVTYENPLKEQFSVIAELNAYERLRDTVAAESFDLSALAKSFIRQEIQNKTNLDIDPDHVYLHNFGMHARNSSTAFTGWEHDQKPIISCTLTELVLRNFDAQAQSKDDATLNLMYGVYRDGPDKSFFGVANEVPITASDLRKIIRDGDFEKKVTQKLSKFWNDHETDVRTLGRARFIGAAKLAKSEGQLSEADYCTVMKGGAPHVPVSGPVTLAELQATAASDASVSVRRLDINGYASSDILLFKDAGNGREILYVPGERQPFHAFDDDLSLRQWIAEQGKDDATSFHLISHFSLYERQDGLIFSGVESGLAKLGSGSWPVNGKGINRNDGAVHGDVFDEVVQKTKARSFQDADTLVTSNSEVKRDIWLGYLRVANQVFSPLLALVGGPAGVAVGASAFIAQLGLETDQVVQGDTEFERRQAAIAVGADIGMALLFGVCTASPKESEMSSMPSMLTPEEPNEVSFLDELSQRLHNIRTQGLGGRISVEAVRNWSQQTVRENAQLRGQMAGPEVVSEAHFLLVNPRFSTEARTFLNHVMDQGILIDEAVERELTENVVDFKILPTMDGELASVLSSDVGLNNFVSYQKKSYLRYLDRLFLLETTKDPIHYFVVRSALDENKPLCTLTPELRVNKNSYNSSVVLKESILEEVKKTVGNVRYYGIDALKKGDENLYDFLKASIKNAKTLLQKAQERLSIRPMEPDLGELLQNFGINHASVLPRDIRVIMRNCELYLDSLGAAFGDRVIVMERPMSTKKDIAFAITDDPVKRIYLHESFFQCPTLEAATTLIHEASHLVADASDLWYASNTSDTVVYNGTLLNRFEYAKLIGYKTQFRIDAQYSMDGLANLTKEKAEEAVKSGALMSDNFVDFIQKVKNKNEDSDAKYTLHEAIDAFNTDPKIKASAILHNADSISQLAEAIASSSYFRGEFHIEDATQFVSQEWGAIRENWLKRTRINVNAAQQGN